MSSRDSVRCECGRYTFSPVTVSHLDAIGRADRKFVMCGKCVGKDHTRKQVKEVFRDEIALRRAEFRGERQRRKQDAWTMKF